MKKIISMLLCACMLLCCAAMAETEAPDLKTIADANDLSVLLTGCATVDMAVSMIPAAGEPAENVRIAIDANGTALYEGADGAYVEYATQNEVFCKDEEYPDGYLSVFLDDAERAAFMDYYYSYTMSYSETETVLESAEADGVLTVKTEEAISEDDAAAFTDAGFADPTAIRYQYEIDQASGRIAHMQCMVVSGEEETLYSEVAFSYSDEMIAEPEFVTAITASEPRKLTIHYNDETLEYQAYKGYYARFNVPDGYQTCIDAEGTPATDDFDINADAEVYLLPTDAQ